VTVIALSCSPKQMSLSLPPLGLPFLQAGGNQLAPSSGGLLCGPPHNSYPPPNPPLSRPPSAPSAPTICPAQRPSSNTFMLPQDSLSNPHGSGPSKLATIVPGQASPTPTHLSIVPNQWKPSKGTWCNPPRVSGPPSPSPQRLRPTLCRPQPPRHYHPPMISTYRNTPSVACTPTTVADSLSGHAVATST